MIDKTTRHGPYTSETATISSWFPRSRRSDRSRVPWMLRTIPTSFLFPFLPHGRLSPRENRSQTSAEGREKSRKRKNASSHATWKLSSTIHTNERYNFSPSLSTVVVAVRQITEPTSPIHDRFVRACVRLFRRISSARGFVLRRLNCRGIAAPRDPAYRWESLRVCGCSRKRGDN